MKKKKITLYLKCSILVDIDKILTQNYIWDVEASWSNSYLGKNYMAS